MTDRSDPIENRQSKIGKAWAAWSRFWFSPADPTPLCLMRIVTGLLVLYVHVAYTFDLQALFGPDGWYPTAMADRERREWPVFVPQTTWGQRPVPPLRMPDNSDQRHALRVFIENLTADPVKQDRVFHLLGNLATSDTEGWLVTFRFLKDMPLDFVQRQDKLNNLTNALTKMTRTWNGVRPTSALWQVSTEPGREAAPGVRRRCPRAGRRSSRRHRRPSQFVRTAPDGWPGVGPRPGPVRPESDNEPEILNGGKAQGVSRLHRILVRPAGRPGPHLQGPRLVFAVFPRDQPDRHLRPAWCPSGDHPAVHLRRLHAGDLGADLGVGTGVHPTEPAGAVRPGHDDEPVPVLPDVRPVRGDVVGGFLARPPSGRGCTRCRPATSRRRTPARGRWYPPTSYCG